jgi:hypothetical protein
VPNAAPKIGQALAPAGAFAFHQKTHLPPESQLPEQDQGGDNWAHAEMTSRGQLPDNSYGGSA